MYLGLRINHIVAMAQNRVIGRAGGMPWHIPEDFKFFKKTTMGHPMIMGRKTWESIGKALPGRVTIVVSRSRIANLPLEVILKPSIDEALKWCKDQQSTWGEDVFIVGGGEIYRQTLDMADRLYITEVACDVLGDTTYPEIPKSKFQLVGSEDHKDSNFSFAFSVYDAKS